MSLETDCTMLNRMSSHTSTIAKIESIIILWPELYKMMSHNWKLTFSKYEYIILHLSTKLNIVKSLLQNQYKIYKYNHLVVWVHIYGHLPHLIKQLIFYYNNIFCISITKYIIDNKWNAIA